MRSNEHSPLCAVGMAGMTFVVGFGILEDETVGALQAIRTLLHTVGTILEMKAFDAVLRPLHKLEHNKLIQSTAVDAN